MKFCMNVFSKIKYVMQVNEENTLESNIQREKELKQLYTSLPIYAYISYRKWLEQR